MKNQYECGEVAEYIDYIRRNPLVGRSNVSRFLSGLEVVAFGFGRTAKDVVLWLIDPSKNDMSNEIVLLRQKILVDGVATVEIKSDDALAYIGDKTTISISKDYSMGEDGMLKGMLKEL